MSRVRAASGLHCATWLSTRISATGRGGGGKRKRHRRHRAVVSRNTHGKR